MAWEANGIKPQELVDHPEISPEGAYLWDYFLQLHRDRGSNGFGANAISSRDILDWQELNGIKLHHWEIRAIKKADMAFLKVQGENATQKAKETQK